MVRPVHVPFAQMQIKDAPEILDTSEELMNWLRQLLANVEVARMSCDVAGTVGEQQDAFKSYMLRNGYALGAASVLRRLRKISADQYVETVKRVRTTMDPTIIGDIRIVS